jgi:hypothetical protein
VFSQRDGCVRNYFDARPWCQRQQLAAVDLGADQHHGRSLCCQFLGASRDCYRPKPAEPVDDTRLRFEQTRKSDMFEIIEVDHHRRQ